MLNEPILKVFTIYVFAFSFLLASRPPNDADLWFHLKTGEHIVQTGRVPRVESSSFTNYGTNFIAHGWLSGLLFYLLYLAFGLRSLTFLTALLSAVAFWIVFRRARAHPFIAGSATLLAVWSSLPTIGARPRVFTLLLASVFLALLDNFARGGKGQAIWLLIPLMSLWANLHGGFLIGFALIGITLVGIPLDAWAAGENARATWPPLRKLALVLGGCLIAGLLNPYGIKLYTFPLHVLSSPVFQNAINDWLSPNFHRPESFPLLLLIVLTTAALALSPKRVRPRDLLLFLATLAATLKATRQMVIFAIVAAPLLAEHSQNWLATFSFGKSITRLPSSWSGRTAKLASPFLLVPLLAFGFRLKETAYGPPTQERLQVPVKAVQFLRERGITGNTFTDPSIWGAYVSWSLPTNPVYIDGRDVYPEQFVKQYIDIIAGRVDWRPPFEKYAVKLVLVQPNSLLARELKKASGWQLLYEDKMAVIFERG